VEQAKQPEWELTAGGERLADQEEVERKGDICHGLGEEDQLDSRSKTHCLPNARQVIYFSLLSP